MAGFSLGGGHTHPHAHTEIPPESLFLYRNVEISPYHTNKGLQLWHHNQQHQQQELQQDIFSGMTPGGPSRRTSTSEELPLRVAPVTIMTRQGSGGGGISCQDCGNQAKKDCPHLRCRTCCKSRGFQCQTHVKSTWVPASRRRERQQQLAAASMQHQQQQHKRPRENSAAAVAGHLACTRLPATTAAAAGLEVSNFPAEVNTPAVFRCVRVSSMDDGDQDLQYAYQAAVNIGGHVFKGILYDQGPDNPHYGHGESSSGGAGDGAGGGDANRSLITVSTASTANTNAVTTSTAAAAAAALLDPSSLFPVPFNAFMAGTQFFPHPRS